MTGGAAILARLRAQRAGGAAAAAAAAAGARKPPPRALFLYASQTGTGSEIAKSLAADAKARGVEAAAMSLNELKFENLTAERAPVAVVVASSTGDGDPPDNGAAFYVALKKQQPPGRLAGVKFAVLGLGDSNYTRFMHVPRAIRSRMAELGAAEFFPPVEADEVDGLECKVDPWCENIWGPLKAALAEAAGGAPAKPAAVPAPAAPAAAAPAEQQQQQQQQQAEAQAQAAPSPAGLVDGLAPEGVDLKGAPALVPPRIEVVTEVSAEAAHRDEDGTYSAAAPFWAKVARARLLTAPGSDRVVVHCTLDISGSGMAYTAGDSIGVLAQNDPAVVDALLERLGLDGDTVFEGGGSSAAALLEHVEWPCTLRHAFARSLDVTGVPRKSLLRVLAEHCGDEAEKRTLLFLCARAGRDDYQREMVAGQPTLLDLLQRFKSCAPPLTALLDALPALAPRMYSICCAPPPGGAPAAEAEFAFSLVTLATPSGARRGVATGWLRRALAPWLGAAAAGGGADRGSGGAAAAAAAGPEVWVPVFLRPSENFGPPKDLSTPLVMVGPGTGVAPFRGFVQQRRAAAAALAGGDGAAAVAAGEAWLYFGCRRRDEDYIFGAEFEGFEANGDLARYRVAFSREGPEGGAKTYVQHLMARDGADLARLVLKDGAHVFVCGDGAAMARDVHAALAAALREHGGLDAAAAEAELKAMAARGAYVRDVWCA